MTTTRRPLYYTFGNHMHWVDMQWLWGYDVLPGSVRDMLRLIEETGARGNVNFDGVGYEKMAAECPEALAELRRAVEEGKVEPVGCSYGQPYGLFHGGESNVRQLTHGVRAVRRLLGVRTRTFWEEEFYFFPQLPQMLAQCGYSGACLFFQWTWHTPEVPRERDPLILWEGIDGTRLPTLSRNELNLHQWPEDFDGVLDRVAAGLPGAIVQWLELMPSRDWMCRSELLLPRLKELMADGRFEIRPRTASKLIEELSTGSPAPQPPVRAYTMDEVWHGVSLGKNGDAHPRESRRVETNIVAASSYSALAGLLGRPYPSWDVYPTWELEESWRELLTAQHHDNHECEGLCGFVAEASFTRADQLAQQVANRTIHAVAQRVEAPTGSFVVFNPAGFARSLFLTVEDERPPTIVRDVPPFGYRAVRTHAVPQRPERINAFEEKGTIVMSRGEFRVTIDKRKGLIRQITGAAFPDGLLSPERPVGELRMVHEDGPDGFERAEVELGEFAGVPAVKVARHARDGSVISMFITIVALDDAVDLTFLADEVPRSEARMHAGLQVPISPAFPIEAIAADHPYGMSRVQAGGSFKRKYPTGDWMTSPQVFETIERPFTALSWLDLVDAAGGGGGRGLMCLHDGGQQFFRDEHGVRALLTMYDAWDEDRYNGRLQARLCLLPHGPMTDVERTRRAARMMSNWAVSIQGSDGGELPAVFGPLEVCGAPSVLAHAFFRESMKSGEHLPQWAGHRMFRESSGACDHPYCVRLVEWGGEPATVTLKLAGPVAMAAKVNLLGELGGDPATKRRSAGQGWDWSDTGWLEVERNVEPPAWGMNADGSPVDFLGKPLEWSAVKFTMRPREIATVMCDMVLGRKQWRDLDAKREVWAGVHRTNDEG